jgi:hypothetical protein
MLKSEFPEVDLSAISINMDNASQFAIAQAANSYLLLSDLRWLLVKAEEGSEFVTSDTPALMHNSFFFGIDGVSDTALTGKGLQFFLPLSPKYTLILYDDAVYRLHGQQSNSSIPTAGPDEVRQLNELQAASCFENFYFQDSGMDVDSIFKNAKRFRRKAMNIQKIFVQEETQEFRKELLFSKQEKVSYSLSLSFVRVRNEAVRWLFVCALN